MKHVRFQEILFAAAQQAGLSEEQITALEKLGPGMYGVGAWYSHGRDCPAVQANLAPQYGEPEADEDVANFGHIFDELVTKVEKVRGGYVEVWA